MMIFITTFLEGSKGPDRHVLFLGWFPEDQGHMRKLLGNFWAVDAPQNHFRYGEGTVHDEQSKEERRD